MFESMEQSKIMKLKMIITKFLKRKMLLCSLVIVIGLVLSSCGDKQSSDNANVAPPTPTYPVFKVASQTATLKTDYPATLQGEQNIEIRPKIDGYIEHICVDEGATVKKGQLLFRINAPQYQQDVNTATAAISSAEADVSAAELQVKSSVTAHQ
jgi:membrane fusion protein (multidrug efflux system)